MKRICIIPARSGSKRVLNKNIRSLAGKPLVSWTIDLALSSNIFDEIILSTDCLKIAEIGKACGLKINNLRPTSLSNDYSTAADVIEYHTAHFEDCYICYLQPTSPLRDILDISASLKVMTDSDYHAVISVSEVTIPADWIYDGDKDFSDFMSGLSNKRSQDYAKSYALNGSIYWFKLSEFRHFGTHLISTNSAPYVMPAERSIDIDEEIDFIIAEALMRSNL